LGLPPTGTRLMYMFRARSSQIDTIPALRNRKLIDPLRLGSGPADFCEL
jgi:hypothetical protein